MAEHRDIEISRSVEVDFPDLCIRCMAHAPEDTLTFGTGVVGWWNIVTWEFGPRFRVQVPICPGCRKRTVTLIWIRRLIDAVILGLGIAIAIFIGDYLLKDWNRGMKRLTMFGIAIASYVPGSELLDYLLPLPLDLTAFTSTVIYQFRDPAYASEFIVLNDVIDEDENQDEYDDEDV